MKTEPYRQDLLITMKRILKDFNNDDDFIKLEGFDENCSEIMQAIIKNTDENAFSLSIKVLKLFVEALNVEQIQGLIDLLKGQISEYTQVYQLASAFYFFSLIFICKI